MSAAQSTAARCSGRMVGVGTAAITEYIQGQLSTGRFPHLDKLARDPAAQSLAGPGPLGQRFERGLRALLDGAIAGAPPAS